MKGWPAVIVVLLATFVILFVGVQVGQVQAHNDRAEALACPACPELTDCERVADEVASETYAGLEACVLINDAFILDDVEKAPMGEFKHRMRFYRKLEKIERDAYLKYNDYYAQEAVWRQEAQKERSK